MTDNEIIKALECLCGKHIYCRQCEYSAHLYYPECRARVAIDALDLINRQKAEIERLEKECKITRAYLHDNGLEWDLLSQITRKGDDEGE